MRIIAVLLLSALVIVVGAAYPIRAATITLSNGQSCSYNNLSIDPNGNALATCLGSSPPQPPPQPTPSPAPTPTPQPAPTGTNAVMKIGGTNNFPSVTDGQVLVYPLPTHWQDGTPITMANIMLASSPGRNPIGAMYEAAFSPIPGDFTYYQNATVSGYTPCGKIWGPDMMITWSTNFAAIDVCKIDNRQWYLNYRVIGCPAGQVCGQTFYVPRG